jgi:hypothetical protein
MYQKTEQTETKKQITNKLSIMKSKLSILAVIIAFISTSFVFAQQDKTKRPSPADSVHVTTDDGIHITIHYSKPSLKGRKVGVDLAKFGEVWRTGANEITSIAFDKDVFVEGKALPKGKYGLWTIPSANETTVIFSKKSEGWGVRYTDQEDQLRVTVKNLKGNSSVEQFTISVEPDGKINLAWGEMIIPIQVKIAK